MLLLGKGCRDKDESEFSGDVTDAVSALVSSKDDGTSNDYDENMMEKYDACERWRQGKETEIDKRKPGLKYMIKKKTLRILSGEKLEGRGRKRKENRNSSPASKAENEGEETQEKSHKHTHEKNLPELASPTKRRKKERKKKKTGGNTTDRHLDIFHFFFYSSFCTSPLQ